ncbi:MAG: heavy metal translocating P-type ATPase, partial [Clostridia bacterium]|nr:heavy metal translocating P-type ATPase [Clostridia bacterium]
MQKFKVTGMSCAACSARVENAVSKLDGVTACSVNLLTGDMVVEGSVAADEITDAVIAAGYGIEQIGVKKLQEKPKEKTDKTIIVRLITSVVLLAVLMYFSMFHAMWGAPLPKAVADNYMAQGLIQLLLSTAVLVINQRFFINGFKGVLKLAPNMDTLVALGSAAAYIYSCVELFEMTAAPSRTARHLLHGLYFESAAMILTLITVGKLLENRAKGKTTNAIKSLLELAPKTVTLLKDGKEITVDADTVLKDDVFIVRAGDSFAVDGIVLEGNSTVDESSLTGESLPVDKSADSRVYSGTINKTGRLICRATGVGEESTLSRIVKMVSDAASTKAPIARIADKVSGIFVPTVLAIALITLIVWLFIGGGVSAAISHAIAVLVISCPCALGLATPVAIMVASGVGARRGVLFKTAASLELCGKCSIAVFDKTGTITSGKPTVSDVMPLNVGENELLEIAYTLEKESKHPLALAVSAYAEQKGVKALDIKDFNETAGFGVQGIIDSKDCFACSIQSAKDKAINTDDIDSLTEKLSVCGKTSLLFVRDKNIIGVIAVADKIKPQAKSAITTLKSMGLRTVMLTGDNPTVAAAVAKAVGIDEIRSQIKPDGKAEVVSGLQRDGRVIMVGDGINDAPALTTADIGMAIGSGMDIAIDSADVVLSHGNLFDVCDAIALSRKAIRNIKQNLFWAFAYNTIGIPIAAGALYWAGINLSPMLAAAAMSLSSFCVVSNALRLNLFKGQTKIIK